jgi:murein DD-endopeptidase MepM/ murein hydrolase activator NlpD
MDEEINKPVSPQESDRIANPNKIPVIPEAIQEKSGNQPGGLMSIWESLSRIGWAEVSLKIGTHILFLALVGLVLWAIPKFYFNYSISMNNDSALAASPPTPTAEISPPQIPVGGESLQGSLSLVPRQVNLHTIISDMPRTDVVTYKVKSGDTLFGIAEKFGLKPETLLWGNQLILGDNPHNLRPDQELNILPVDGTYYRWQEGDGLNGVASFFDVKPEDIVSYPGNHLDANNIGDYAHPNIPAGTWLIVPGGTRAFVTWSAPEIPRDNPEVAKVLGPGACESIPQGPIGAAIFIWPANNHFLSGYDYTPSTNHYGIDIDGETGDPVYASDSGVVVYSGWNNWGYGNVVVINHGNGWQTLYAHLSNILVGCGQSVIQGGVIGAIGETGNASGSHLHFEMMYNGTKVNPWNYLP